jgi:hypothetical protein
MVASETFLTVFGLGLDVIGAGLLAVPDFPSLRTHTKQGEIETAIHQLESDGLKPSHPAFDRVKSILEDLYGFKIEDDIEGIRVGMATMSRNPEYDVYIYRTDEDSYSPDTELNWNYVRSVLAEKAVESEQRFRRIGFGLLACGFIFQIIASAL